MLEKGRSRTLATAEAQTKLIQEDKIKEFDEGNGEPDKSETQKQPNEKQRDSPKNRNTQYSKRKRPSTSPN
jgi:hypothetical protein